MMFLGIDCGTQSLKLLAWDPERKRGWTTSRKYGLIEGLPPGHKEQEPRQWIDALNACMEELSTQIDIKRIGGIGVSGQQHGLVVLDANDNVIRPAKLWNDTSTDSQCREIIETAGGLTEYQREIGNHLPPGFTASKLLWLKQKEPDAYQKLKTFFLPHDYLNFYLTGEKIAEPGDASGTGYFNVQRRVWSKEALGWIDPDRDLSAFLPELRESDQICGVLRPALADRWGLSQSIKVSTGGGDNMMGAIGSGNVAKGLTTVSLGTSGTIYAFSDRPVIDPNGDIAAFCDSTGGWLPLGCTMNVTVATEMVRKNLAPFDHDDFDRGIGSIAAGAEGLILLPYLEGERMPSVPNGCGVLLGLRPATASPFHLARAAMEGVTMGLRYGLDRLAELGCASSEIRLTGGGARSLVWRQIAANLFQTPVVCLQNEEGPAFGAALQAMWSHEDIDIRDLAQEQVILDEESRTLPSNREMDFYDRQYALYCRLSGLLTESDIFERHRNLIQGGN